MPVSFTKWSADLPQTKTTLQERKAQLLTDLAEAEQEKAAWTRLQGTPGMHDGTKDRHFTKHGLEWAAVVTQIKAELVNLETDINSFALIQ